MACRPGTWMGPLADCSTSPTQPPSAGAKSRVSADEASIFALTGE